MSGEPWSELLVACVAIGVVLWAFKQAFSFSVWAPTSDFGGGCLGTIANAIWVLILIGVVGAVVYLVLDQMELINW